MTIAVVTLVSTPSHAQEGARRLSSLGDEYVASRNVYGGILTSVSPKRWRLDAPSRPDVIYFGRDCDAFHTEFGNGTWGWANGGFIASFEGGMSIGFPRQELPWEGLDHCRL